MPAKRARIAASAAVAAILDFVENDGEISSDEFEDDSDEEDIGMREPGDDVLDVNGEDQGNVINVIRKNLVMLLFEKYESFQ